MFILAALQDTIVGFDDKKVGQLLESCWVCLGFSWAVVGRAVVGFGRVGSYLEQSTDPRL